MMKRLYEGGFTDRDSSVSVKRGVSGLIEELRSSQEEGDTRLLLHAKHADIDHPRIVIQSPDIDVAVLCT